jgi:hypothetical protein
LRRPANLVGREPLVAAGHEVNVNSRHVS